MQVMTAARYSRADKHGNGGGKLLSATMREIPDATMDYAIADMMLTMQTTLNNLTYSIFYGFTHLCEAVYIINYQNIIFSTQKSSYIQK